MESQSNCSAQKRRLGRWLAGYKNMNVEARDGIPVTSCEEGERPEDPCADCMSHHVLFSAKKAIVTLTP